MGKCGTRVGKVRVWGECDGIILMEESGEETPEAERWMLVK